MLTEPRLVKIAFTEADLPAVQSFACGDRLWEAHLSDWIKGKSTDDTSVIEAMQDGTKVWLYMTQQGGIVGYGSLGVTTWSYPSPYGGEKATFGVIPALAVNLPFQGQPPGNWEQRYSTEIIGDLIAEAVETYRTGSFPDPLLGLFVDTRNVRAKKLYVRMGFEDFGK